MENKKKLRFNLAIILFTILIFSNCKRDSTTTTNTDMYTISATMSAANEVPGLNTTTFSGTGAVTGTFNSTTNVLQYSVGWNGISGAATAAHFHGPALAGANAAIVIPFTVVNNGNTGSATGTITLSDAQKADLLAGKWYANVHTATNPGGEIRGQVSATK